MIDSVKAAIQKNIDGTTVTTSADLAKTVSGSLSTASGQHLITPKSLEDESLGEDLQVVDEAPDGFCGLSMIAAPDGRVLAEAPAHGEAVVVADPGTHAS